MKNFHCPPGFICYLLGIVHRGTGTASVSNGKVYGKFLSSGCAAFESFADSRVEDLTAAFKCDLIEITHLQNKISQLKKVLSGIEGSAALPSGSKARLAAKRADQARSQAESQIYEAVDAIDEIRASVEAREKVLTAFLEKEKSKLTGKFLKYAYGTARGPVGVENVPEPKYEHTLEPYFELKKKNFSSFSSVVKEEE